MIVPRYWAEARVQAHLGKRQVTVRRFGYADESQAAAEADARARAEAALTRILRGEPLARRERKQPYPGGDGLPIREEVVARHGDVVITRNAYGARCLNVSDVLFVDVDFDRAPSPKVRLPVLFSFAALVFGLVFWRASWCAAVVSGCAALVVGFPLMDLATRTLTRLRGGEEAFALRRVRAFSAAHPEHHLRVYRTPRGLRVLAMERTFDPLEAATSAIFAALAADETYVRMCRTQRCFRARISPKPWRIGEPSVSTVSRAVWPIPEARMPMRARWVTWYETASASYAACRFLERMGRDVTCARTEEVRRLHDEACRAHEALPLA